MLERKPTVLSVRILEVVYERAKYPTQETWQKPRVLPKIPFPSALAVRGAWSSFLG